MTLGWLSKQTSPRPSLEAATCRLRREGSFAAPLAPLLLSRCDSDGAWLPTVTCSEIATSCLWAGCACVEPEWRSRSSSGATACVGVSERLHPFGEREQCAARDRLAAGRRPLLLG